VFEKELKERKKVFIVAGELSGDKTAAWYVKKVMVQKPNIYFEAVGGNFLESCGVKIYERFEKLNVVGIFEIIHHLPHILRFMRRIVEHVKSNKFDEVVLVDFPGFNLRVAKKLKSQIPGIKITYLAPPQLWCWGAWRIKKLKKYCDKVVVLYPFEVEWYAKRGLNAEWIGNPVYDDIKKYFELAEHKENLIALIPGSRISEIKRFTPLLAEIVKLFGLHHPGAKFVLPLAESISEDFIRAEMKKYALNQDKIKILRSEQEKFEYLAKCCLAITKPGTVTLELALLKVPAVVFFRISWLTYIIGRPLVKVPFMSLPNLLTNFMIYRECIQGDCKSKYIFDCARRIYQNFVRPNCEYKSFLEKLNYIRILLGQARL
jgi:lipid-A-disaccharide synthase